MVVLCRVFLTVATILFLTDAYPRVIPHQTTQSAHRVSALRLGGIHQGSRRSLLVSIPFVLLSPVVATAEATDTEIKKCTTNLSTVSCVSTSNVRDIQYFSPPWSFDVTEGSGGEIWFDRLLDAVEGEEGVTVTAKRSDWAIEASTPSTVVVPSATLKFKMIVEDGIVLFESRKGEGGVGGVGGEDLRKRLERIRQRGGFGLGGSELNTADSAGVTTNNGRDFKSQLKAFYGLQSGAGYEDVFLDD